MNLRDGLITELIKERRLHLQREDIIKGADAIDKKAYWKIYKRIDSDAHKTCECSKCGYSAPVIIAKTPYCPMCGSEMENGNNETV